MSNLTPITIDAPAARDLTDYTPDELVAASETTTTGFVQVIAFCDGCDEFTECSIDSEMVPLCAACI